MYMEVQLKRQDSEKENVPAVAAEGGADPLGFAHPSRVAFRRTRRERS
jgi:hypothetical protein